MPICKFIKPQARLFLHFPVKRVRLTASVGSRNQLLSFLNELRRRNVHRAGAAYVVSAWLVIQVAETIFPLFGFDDTPARVVVIVLAIGFIPAMVFAWAFELTPEGLKKESDIDRSQSITAYTGRKLDRMIMLVLVLGLAYFAFDKIFAGTTATG